MHFERLLPPKFFLMMLVLLLPCASWAVDDGVGEGNSLSLSLSQAMGWAVAHHLQMQRVREQAQEAAAQADQAHAALLPNIGFNSYQSRQTQNLRAMGFNIPGFPIVNGPFNTFDARVQFTQQLFDVMHQDLSHSAQVGVEIARLNTEAEAQQRAGAAGLAYIAVQETDESVKAAEANVTLSKALLKLTNDQQKTGLSTGVDRIRAEAALAQSEYQRQQASGEYAEAMTRLKRALGIAQNVSLVLTDTLHDPQTTRDPDASSRAMKLRPELRALEKTLEQREAERDAARAASYPTVGLVGAIGPSGVLPAQYDYRTYSYGIQMSLPLYQGGALVARQDQADSRLRQAQLTLEDSRHQVEEDVRLAEVSLTTQLSQLHAAQDHLTLVQRLLTQSQDRFMSGAADNLELIDAQAQLAAARSDQIAALGALGMASINYELATGTLSFPVLPTADFHP
ncbi:MAG: TolC family protein [Betaproteobacteria bacterium]|jgi:Outer membrane protein|nr:TolC family protein [Betaproteobacteria bacterium]